MSRNEQKIRRVCEELKIKVKTLFWENVTRGCEMEGYHGGWILNDFYSLGLSTEDAIRNLREIYHDLGKKSVCTGT